MQPFRTRETLYRSSAWPEIAVHFREDHLLIQTGHLLDIRSNAVWGDAGQADHIVNWRVGKDFDCSDPTTLMRDRIAHWGYPAETCVGLITAAKLPHASICEWTNGGFRLVVCTTAGTANAARAGLKRPVFEEYAAGTINTVVLLDARMSEAAIVNAIITATEAKAAALQDEGIQDHLYPAAATGTTTDAIVLAVNPRAANGHVHRYAGTATPIGSAIGQLVYRSVRETVSSQGESAFIE
ncbi:adenosylcobinamide amidohydrolase [Cohnella caldifontis]|uniref:adenosylcobinamide amidohydrolase n=1 Tax=Cohnella caldifontis TaxID=3027471 RepID=UPI0023EAECFB|nr:adenosylcobinamide amidohydrolase [Cohnella sp. YIM B05605]